MIRGLYTAASGMVSQLINQDIVANNIANVNTVGFKRTGASFQNFASLLLNKQTGEQSESIGQLSSQNKLYQSAYDWTPGSVQQTGNPLDVAIQGKGFFSVQDDNGESYYTRDGSFQLSADGYLVTHDGKKVESESGPIQLPPGTIQIDKAGQVSVNGQPVAKIKLVTFNNMQALQAQGGNLYTTKQDEQPTTETTLIQGAVERTNVNVVSELLHNMTGLRAYETLQKTFQAHSDLLKKAVTEVGRVR